ncbi:MAG: hypothetical protein ACJ8NR_14185 [Sulfurifustis sp.]
MPHSLLNTNLQLLDNKLQELRDTAYFDQRVVHYIDSLKAIIQKLCDATVPLDDRIKRLFAFNVWQATEFIAGSAPRLQPYEMVYGLQRAITEWFGNKAVGARQPLIVTNLIQEPNFYFKGVHPIFYDALSAIGTPIEYEIIQIKLPELYRRKPLYSVALYHELGHFIDLHYSISENVDVLLPDLALPGMSDPSAGLSAEAKKVRLYHLREYFADLFAACYCGTAMKRFLEGFAPDLGASPTHPEGYDRLQVIGALLDGKQHSLIEAFNQALTARSQPSLGIRFSRPQVDQCFTDIRPVTLTSDEEVFGLLDSAWDYLDRAAAHNTDPWDKLDESEIERIINDLVEKSIRNRMISEQWHRCAS